MNGNWTAYERPKSLAERRLTLLVVLLALCAILPVGKIAKGIINLPEAYRKTSKRMPTELDRKSFGDVMGEIEKRLNNKAVFYSVEELVRDRERLRLAYSDMLILKDVAEQRINCMYERSRSDYVKKNHNDQSLGLYNFESDLNIEHEKLRINSGSPEKLRQLLRCFGHWCLRSYIVMMPFAFIFFLISLHFRKLSIKEELLLAPTKMIMWMLFWPFGLAHYADNDAARWYREKKLEAKYCMAKGIRLSDLTEAEEEMIRCEALRRIEDFDALVSELAEVPVETIKQQSRALAFLTLAMSILLAPLAFAKVGNGCDKQDGKTTTTKIVSSGSDRLPELKKAPDRTINAKAHDGQKTGSHFNPEMSAIIPPSLDPGWLFVIEVAAVSLFRPPPSPPTIIDYVPRIVECSFC